MPFVMMHGTFHLVGLGSGGGPQGFQPDGDSIQFRPATPALLDRLTQLDKPYFLGPIGSLQLRFEGIDALELHYQGAATHQPRPLSDASREFLTGQLGLNPVPYRPPENLAVQPPVDRDAAPGFILSRSLEVYGRPVAFAFAGQAPHDDGEDVFLDPPLLRQSLNYALVEAGHAYPLFYETLFHDLRDEFAAAASDARAAGRGLWAEDVTHDGVAVAVAEDLEEDGVIFPKLFRRLSEYLAEGLGGMDAFPDWLATDQEQVIDLDVMNSTHFDNLIEVVGSTVRMTRPPDRLVFISAK